jgi:hypothetical protein
VKYTITSDYVASGEGRTLMILMCIEPTKEAALEEFKKRFDGDQSVFWTIGADVTEDFNFDNPIAKILITDAAKSQLEIPGLNHYFASLHFNYS